MTAEPAQVERVAALVELATDTPELVIDLDAVRANIDRIASQASSAGVAVRPHTKTHKLPQIARLQVEAGAVGVQVAKLGEADVMADAGIQDLVGYPLVGERKLDRLAAVSVTVDSQEVGAGVSRVARARGITIPVLLELDTGMHRLGVPPGSDAADFAEDVAGLDGIELAGVFTHEGHVYTQARDAAEQERMTHEACAEAVATAEAIRSRGVAAEVVSVGSAADRMLVPGPPLTFGCVYGHDDWDVMRLSEEHGVVSVPADAHVRIGDRLAIVPNHVCPTINLANYVTVAEGGRLADRWPVAARGLVQ